MAVATPSAPIPVAAPRAVPPTSRTPAALLVALLAAIAYAAFADGAVGLPREAWVQLALIAVASIAVVWTVYASRLGVTASAAAWTAVVLLAAHAIWAGVTILWSVAPDRSWLELNRGLAYALTLTLGIAIGSTLPRAAERAVKGFGVVAALVALYALGGKTVPGLHVDGLINLDHAGGYARLREPFGYWNALGLFCVLGAPGMLRLASDPARRAAGRLVGLAGAYLLLVVLGFTYSRGGVIAMGVALLVLIAVSREKLRPFLSFLMAAGAAAIPLAVAFTRPDLTANVVPLARREDDASAVLVAFLVAGTLLMAAGWLAIRLESHRALTPRRTTVIRRAVAGAIAGLAALTFLGAIAAGAPGELSRSFTQTRQDLSADPNRLVSVNSGNRWNWWKEAAGAWWDRPVQGWGAGSFPVTHRMYRKDRLSVQQPHNVPLQFLAETGLVGAGLALGALLALMVAGLSRARRTPGAERGYVAALAALPVAWTLHSVVDWDWDIPAVTLPMFLLGGIAAAQPAAALDERLRDRTARALGLAAAVALLIVMALSSALPAIAKIRSESALAGAGDQKATPEELRRAAREAELASRLNPLAVDSLFAAATISERRGSLERARTDILRALRRQPDNVEAWFRLIRIDFVRLDRESLRRATQRALELDPLNPTALFLGTRAASALTPPGESATATGSPLPQRIPVTEPDPPGALTPPSD